MGILILYTEHVINSTVVVLQNTTILVEGLVTKIVIKVLECCWKIDVSNRVLDNSVLLRCRYTAVARYTADYLAWSKRSGCGLWPVN